MRKKTLFPKIENEALANAITTLKNAGFSEIFDVNWLDMERKIFLLRAIENWEELMLVDTELGVVFDVFDMPQLKIGDFFYFWHLPPMNKNDGIAEAKQILEKQFNEWLAEVESFALA